MAVLSWDNTSERFYETGIKKGVLYPYTVPTATKGEFSPTTQYSIGDIVVKDGVFYKAKSSVTAGTWSVDKWDIVHAYAPGVAWNGLSSVSENPSGADENAIYADDIKYLSLRSAEEFGLTVEAYTYPDEFGACDGSASIAAGVTIGQQSRKMFGLCYRTIIGNDVQGDDLGYKLHLVYGCTASPSSRQYQTVNDSPEAITFSWEITTTPATVDASHKPSATVTIDSRFVDSSKLADLEKALYGTATADPYLPSPAEVVAMLSA